MLKKAIVLGLVSWCMQAFGAIQTSVFVSFSMPEKLLQQILEESALRHTPVYIRGLYHDSMHETAQKLMRLGSQNFNLNIDPDAFERFDIRQVPALVIDDGKFFDVIYGNLTIQESVVRMLGHGDVQVQKDKS